MNPDDVDADTDDDGSHDVTSSAAVEESDSADSRGTL